MGRELIRALDKENQGCLFIAHYHSSAEALEAIPLREGNALMPVRADLSDDEDVESLIRQVQSVCDAPTHIVHLAARPFRYMKLKEFDADSLRIDIDIQVCSFMHIMQVFLPVMAKRRAHNKVVVVTSYVVERPPRFMADYIITKHALLGAVRAVAADYAGKAVNINALSPSMVETKFLQNVDSRIVQMTAAGSPGGRNATPADIVPAAVFLLSDGANYIHGENLCVTNGSTV